MIRKRAARAALDKRQPNPGGRTLSDIEIAREATMQQINDVGHMKPVKGITEAQLSAIVEYVRAVQQVNGLF